VTSSIPNPFARFMGRAGSEDPVRSTLWTTPWSWRTDDGIYVGHGKDAWLYRELPLNPLQWEDPGTRLQIGSPLATLLEELGSTSKDTGAGLRTLARLREIHLVAVTWEAPAKLPEETGPQLRDFLAATLRFTVPYKALFVGVKLRSSVTSTTAKKQGGGLLEQIKSMTAAALAEDVPNLDPFEKDITSITSIMARNGAKVPARDSLRHLESWYNLGRGPDVEVKETRDLLYVDDFDVIEMAAVRAFEQPVMRAPHAQWLLAAATHPEGPSVVSVRGQLEPASMARGRLRATQRKFLNQLEEQAATGDLERAEDSQTLNLAKEVEDYFVSSGEPLISECSIVMARRASSAEETYIDELRGAFGIDVTALQHRQLAALDETLPCSQKRVNPFVQDVSIGMLAYAGLQAFSNLGDRKGVFVGLTDPDYTPTWLDPFGAPEANLPPAMAVFGDPGSGKTFLCQTIATQAALEGHTVIMVNPKGFDSLSPTADLVGGTTVRMSALEGTPGFFDPARYAPNPAMAAEIASAHILSVLGTDFTGSQELALSVGLKRGFLGGARCVNEALEHVDDDFVKRLVREQAEASATFALGIAKTPLPPLDGIAGGLTLIEFDRKLDLPDAAQQQDTHTREQRVALSAIRLVSRASLEILNRAGGGLFILDEAWTFLGSSAGLAMLQQLGREGRSLNILPIFATQRVADLIKDGVNLEGYLSRVFVMKLMEEREAKAALQLCGLEATPQWIDWLRKAGPRQAEGDRPARAALAIHRDIKNRHAAVMIGPVPEAARVAFSTKPSDRRRRDAAHEE
jgi:hypothetical protein